MDTSEKYIKMCDCIEVQGCKSGLDRNDFFRINYDNIPDLTNFVFFVTGHIGDLSVGKEAIWLPRQDQTQEMIDNPSGIWVHRHNRFHFFVSIESKLDHSWALVHDTQEKAWLAFYMHEKHGKVWDGEKWGGAK